MPPEIELDSLASGSASASTTQAMVCGIRVSVQAIANTLCFSTTATLLTYTLVHLAMSASHRYRNYAIAAVTIFLVVWFTAGCTVYLAFFWTLHRRSMEERRRSSGSCSIATSLPLSDVKKQQAHGMDVLPRESPVHGRVTSASIIPACEQPDGEPSGDGRLACAVCREEVERWEMARRFPACLHVFHQRCIDWRRLRMHSTCPVCRADAEAPLLDQRCKSDDLLWSLFSDS